MLEPYVTVNAPATRWAQLGAPVVTCESMAVGVSSAREEKLFPLGKDCQILEVIDIVAVIARECVIESDNDGNTDPAKVEANSVKLDADVMALKAWVESLPRPADAITNHTFQIEGGLGLVITATSVYAGWVEAT